MELCSSTIPELLEQTIVQFGNRVAVKACGEQYTWREIGILSDTVARKLAQRGVVEGAHVGLWGGNDLNWMLTFLAILKLKAIAVLINNKYTKHELAGILKLSNIEWLCIGSCTIIENEVTLDQIEKISGIETDQVIDIRYPLPLYRTWLAEPHDVQIYNRNGNSRALCCLMFTSGSSAQPKCVMISHYSLVNNAISMAEKLGLRDTDIVCLAVPLFHIFGLCVNFLASMYMGASVAVPGGQKSTQILQCIQNYKCSILNGVPTSYLALIHSPQFLPEHIGSLRLGVMGGAPLLAHQMDKLQAALPGMELMINYGQTEGACISNTEHGDTIERLSSTVGRPLPHISVAVEDPMTGHRLVNGQIGELVVTGYNVMQGLYPPSSEQHVIDKHGWLHTEDLGTIDENGYISIVGRKKEIIIRGGEDITPREIENALIEFDEISDVKVFGIPHEILGEQVIACVIPQKGVVCEEAKIKAALGRNLASFKIPSHIIQMEVFPLCGNGKIDLQGLKRMVSAQFTG